MKKICITFLLLFIIFLTVGCSGFNFNTDTKENAEYLRIHVRANSNGEKDQTIKYLIKDKIVSFLTPYIADCHSKSDAVGVITLKRDVLKGIIDEILLNNGFHYKSNIIVRQEKFPTRVYGEITLESGYYDAVIVELGEAKGDNWWCVVYPPFCFTDGEKVEYKSKIKEIIDDFLKRRR
ncbi:MAG: stage II sporulation protein R [Clostridia bacterium]|nr:stage II sporulation protein R [Clostridia bacterium]